MNVVEHSEIVRLARENYLGVKWKHQGRSIENGLDCVGLPVLVGSSLGLWKPLVANYSRRPDQSFLDEFRKYMIQMRPIDQQDGDVLVFAQFGQPCHCGIRSTYHGVPGVIHAHAGCRKVIEQTIESSTADVGSVIAYFRYPGVV